MAEDYLTQGIAAVQAGNKQEARRLLDAAIRAAPNDERTWGWFYNVCINDKERLRCLNEVLRINPNNEIAKKKFEALTARQSGLNDQSLEMVNAQEQNGIEAQTQQATHPPAKRAGRVGCWLMILVPILIFITIVLAVVLHK